MGAICPYKFCFPPLPTPNLENLLNYMMFIFAPYKNTAPPTFENHGAPTGKSTNYET